MKTFGAVVCLLLALGGLALTSAAEGSSNEPSFYEQLLREVKRQEEALKGKDLNQLADKFMDDVSTIGKEFTSILRHAMAFVNQQQEPQANDSVAVSIDEQQNQVQTPEVVVKTKSADDVDVVKTNTSSKDDKSIMDILTEILMTTMAEDGSEHEARTRQKRDTAASLNNADITSMLQRLLQGNNDNKNQPEVNDEAKSAAAVSTRLGKPAPIVLIPGPPGKPGKPGVPGLPGKPGKLPNFRGLKAIITTRVAELLAFLAFLALASIAKFLGLLGLLLGLALPIYGKLKKAGVVVPGQDQEPSYGGAPAYGSPYGRRKRSILLDDAPSDKMAAYVLGKVESAQKRFE